MKLFQTLLIGLILTGCAAEPKERLQYGLHETDLQTVVWVAIDKEIQFLFEAPPIEEIIEEMENWQEKEFNVFYTFRIEGRRVPILVYGDINEGIITAAYRNEPLNLEDGTFFSEKDDQILPMSQNEKETWISKIRL